MKKIFCITGGQRSGKSSYAQQLALSLSPRPVYLATSRVWDDEHRKRIERHKADRNEEWINLEEEKLLSLHHLEDQVIVIDCVTLWATNFFFDEEGDVDKCLSLLQEEFNKFTNQDAIFIFVTNEIGLGGTRSNDLQRKFTDLLGWLNQFIASASDEVIFMVSGIPLKIK